MTGSITLGRVTITSSGYDPESKEPTVDPALARATGATRAERDAAVLEAVRLWRECGQVGIPTPKGLAILAHVLFPGPALKSLDGRAVSASLARLKAQGKVHNGPGTLGWEACVPTEGR